ncbi:MAG: HDIG domain-containing protein [Ignavibacteria bacterium]|jgi:putative nucleotidyltransferase with HDIG domain|nr:HDIG domain-containing protein [Ignavibacteria bacterium]
MLNLYKNINNNNYLNDYTSENKKRHSLTIRIVICVLTILICSFFYCFNINTPSSNVVSSLRLENGYIWTAPSVVAEYNFAVYKPKLQYSAEVQNARDSAQSVFILDAFAEQNSIERISSLIQKLSTNDDISSLYNYISRDKLKKFIALEPEVKKREIDKLNKLLIPYIKSIYKRGIINITLDKLTANDVITVRPAPNQEYSINRANLLDKQALSIETQIFSYNMFDEHISNFLGELLYKILQSNLIYSEELTKRNANLAEKSVQKTLGIMRKGELIVEKGDRLDDDRIIKLKSYYSNRDVQNQEDYTFLNILGNIGNVFIALSLLFFYLIIIRQKIWRDNYQLLLICVPIIITCFLGWISYQYELVYPDMPLEYLVILPACSMFIAIIFDSRTAFYSTVSMALLLAGVRENDYYIGLVMLFTGSIAAYSVKDIQDRTQIFSAIIFIFVGFIISIFSISLERGFNFSKIMPQLLFALINAIIAPLLTFLAIFYLNKYSRYITTDIKLKEYDDENNPLLVEMKQKAPGSFEHSREVAQLAQKCAEAIGANALLAKVGALYHDIGKLNNPEYFTENKDIYMYKDKHSLLTPQKSAEVIKEHIKYGIENAEKNKLPQQIIDFIPMHHGTTLIKHFYNVALNNAAENDNSTVNEEDFRYPGPKPRTKEAVIVMLSDSAEAVSKSSNDLKQFETIFNGIIKERIFDGQFNESNITLQEIDKIKTVITEEIKGKLHTRTKYETLKKDKDEVNEIVNKK